MIGIARKWLERQKALAARAPRVRIDAVTTAAGDKGEYGVVIEGFGLSPAVTPPTITIGGARVEELKFGPGGRRVTGVLRSPSSGDEIVVDLGHARAAGRVKQHGKK
jgi:hypothetical protein